MPLSKLPVNCLIKNFQFIGVIKTAKKLFSQGIFGEGGVAHSWDRGGIDSSS
jgi:hypothetical protein